MATISDEIRDWSDFHGGDYLYAEDCDGLCAIADRIDNEMIELPKDADGFPIHIDDTMYYRNSRFQVKVLSRSMAPHDQQSARPRYVVCHPRAHRQLGAHRGRAGRLVRRSRRGRQFLRESARPRRPHPQACREGEQVMSVNIGIPQAILLAL